MRVDVVGPGSQPPTSLTVELGRGPRYLSRREKRRCPSGIGGEARTRRWTGESRNWTPVGNVTLDPERNPIVV
ncbi:MAG: hypothetical protein BGO98_33670 [Myxococcales bacterium 68-20]|nr:MAG: hypothetical protein BGO98_33670 [Myxococcales bacterium 68-20]